MGAKKTDISQIRKYLNGELDAHAMHQLEREAQDDPFLMEAIDGYEEATGLQQRQLNDLDARLKQRVSQSKTRKIIPWKYYAAAASALIVFTLGYLLWPSGQQVPEKRKMAATKVIPPAVDHTIKVPDTLLKAPAPDQMLATVTPPVNHQPTVSQTQIQPATPAPAAAFSNRAAIRIDEPVGNSDTKAVTEDVTEKKEAYKQTNTFGADRNSGYVNARVDTSLFVRKANRITNRDSAVLKEITIRGSTALAQKDLAGSNGLTAQTLQGKVNGAQVTTPEKINGTVLNDLGLPLSGASIVVNGTNKITQTDANGRFSIPADGQATLDVRSMGYESRRVSAKASDSVKVALNSYGKIRPVKLIKEAHPQIGWDNYTKYLDREAIAYDDKPGTVQLSFTVNEKGELSDFHILKSLGNDNNQQAIYLLKKGPVWSPDISGKAKTVKLKIHFGKKE